MTLKELERGQWDKRAGGGISHILLIESITSRFYYLHHLPAAAREYDRETRRRKYLETLRLKILTSPPATTQGIYLEVSIHKVLEDKWRKLLTQGMSGHISSFPNLSFAQNSTGEGKASEMRGRGNFPLASRWFSLPIYLAGSLDI